MKHATVTELSQEREDGYYTAKDELLTYIMNRFNVLTLLHETCQSLGDKEGALEVLYKCNELEKVFLELTKEFAGEEEK